MKTTSIYTETVSKWQKGSDTVLLKVTVNGLGFCAEFYENGRFRSRLQFKAADGIDALAIFRHLKTVENFLFNSGWDGYFFDFAA